MTCHAKNPPTPAGLYLSNKSMSVISAQFDHAPDAVMVLGKRISLIGERIA